MRILLDECLPRDLKGALVGHQARTVGEMGWAGVKNGTLLTLAELDFEVFLTADRNIRYQQNMQSRRIILAVLSAPDTKVESLRPLVPALLKALDTAEPGSVLQL